MWADKRKWRGCVAVGLVVFGVGGLVSVEVTSQPWFCNSCHIMEPYYTSWQTSAHRDVSCVKCHIEPGMDGFIHAKLNGLGQVVDDLLSRTSFKPSASVDALSCTRSGCHSVETLAGKTIDNGRFKFRHDKHIGIEHLGVEITCSTCHSHVMGDDHFEVHTNVCITCHMVETDPYDVPDGRTPVSGEVRFAVRAGYTPPTVRAEGAAPIPPSACLTCHEAPKGLIEYQGLKVDHSEYLSYGASCESCHRNATVTPQPIEDGRCIVCHTFGNDHSLSTEEMHRVHALGKHKIECFNCHGMVQHGVTAQAMTLEQFDCRKCHINEHSAQRDAYLLASRPAEPHGAPGVDGVINPMFLAHVDCTGCHVRDHPGSDSPVDMSRVRIATPDACDRCHKPGYGEQMIPMWQNSTRTLFDRVAARLDMIDRDGLTPDAETRVRQATELLELVRLDGSWGVHNPEYTQQLLERALGKVTEVINGATGAAAGGATGGEG